MWYRWDRLKPLWCILTLTWWATTLTLPWCSWTSLWSTMLLWGQCACPTAQRRYLPLTSALHLDGASLKKVGLLIFCMLPIINRTYSSIFCFILLPRSYLELISQADGGQAKRLQQMQVPVLENEICERNYYFGHPGGITVGMLCAGFVSVGGQDLCQVS